MKLLLNLWRFLNSIFLQLLLSVVAFKSYNTAIELGSKTYKAKTYDILRVETDISVTAGFDGGAIAMGLITCMCIFGIVWLQVNKSKQ